MIQCKSVIISGRPGSGKSALAKEISKQYGWKMFSVGRLWREIWNKTYPGGEMTFEMYWRNTSIEENMEMDKKAGRTIQEGRIVADLRFSKAVSDPDVLKVFVDADLEVRARRVIEAGRYKMLAVDDVCRILVDREKDEVRMGKYVYGEDYDYRNLLNYNVALNSGMLDIEDEVKMIGEFITG